MRPTLSRFSLILCALGALALCMMQGVTSAWAAPQITGLSIQTRAGEELLELQFSAPVQKQKLFQLSNPQRVALDLSRVENYQPSLPADYHSDLITSLRFGQNSPTTSRLVITLQRPIKSASVHEFSAQDGMPMRLVISLQTQDEELQHKNRSEKDSPSSTPSFFSFFTGGNKNTTPEATSSRDAPSLSVSTQDTLPAGYRPSFSVGYREPQPQDDVKKNTVERIDTQSVSARDTLSETERPQASSPEPTPLPSSASNSASTAKAHPTTSGKPLIFIDAGHGGKDPGAAGKNGEREKDITLAYAKALQRALQDSGRYRAKLTRDDDRFIVLGERVEIARRAGANLFISIHADSAPDTEAEGLSVYTVSETASDAASAKLAASENSVDSLGGIAIDTKEKAVVDILTDLAMRETKNKSTDLARHLTRGIQREDIRTLKDPHRFAGFRVLKAPDVPSVLIELGFISTPHEAAQLKSASHRASIIRGIVAGVDDYFDR